MNKIGLLTVAANTLNISMLAFSVRPLQAAVWISGAELRFCAFLAEAAASEVEWRRRPSLAVAAC